MKKDLENLKKNITSQISSIDNEKQLDKFWLTIFGSSGQLPRLLKKIKQIPVSEKPGMGKLANKIKTDIEKIFSDKRSLLKQKRLSEKFDVTIPGILPPQGHLHLVTQAITEISSIFEKIGFTRIRYPEIEWEWYAFEALNMPKEHPARDDFETFFIDQTPDKKLGQMVLSPHTSSGQVREMERLNHQPPIRMTNIAKCYRPNWDVSHTPMFHQFEGLVIDKDINITHLKGTIDYFAKMYFGKTRKTRLRPFHFRFTEPSFEVDINCGVCQGKGVLQNGKNCRLCKSGWLELGGAGMVHPTVLKMGKINPLEYTGFAFGWGVERTFMMKQGLKIDDIRLLYQNDIRFLEQF